MEKILYNDRCVIVSRRKDDNSWFVYSKAKDAVLYSGNRIDVAAQVAKNEQEMWSARVFNKGVRL